MATPAQRQEEYRAKAEEMEQQAAKASNPLVKDRLLKIAAAYREMAEALEP